VPTDVAKAIVSASGRLKTDFELVARLSGLLTDLSRLRADSASSEADLRARRSAVVRARAFLRADSLASEAVRNNGETDRVTADILDAAVDGAKRAVESATHRAKQGADSLSPALLRLGEEIALLENEAEGLHGRLSPAAARAVDVLWRRKVLPLVASVEDRACGACHLCLPTALASAVALSQAIHRCPHCKRILVTAAPGPLASVS